MLKFIVNQQAYQKSTVEILHGTRKRAKEREKRRENEKECGEASPSERESPWRSYFIHRFDEVKKSPAFLENIKWTQNLRFLFIRIDSEAISRGLFWWLNEDENARNLQFAVVSTDCLDKCSILKIVSKNQFIYKNSSILEKCCIHTLFSNGESLHRTAYNQFHANAKISLHLMHTVICGADQRNPSSPFMWEMYFKF